MDVQFTSANTTFPIAHGLGRKPTGYIQAGASAATSIYNTQDPDGIFIYLKSSAIAIVQVVIF